MAGILDNKTRIMDLVVTEEGRRQIVSGRLNIQFASFTDCHTFYQGDVSSGSDDASNRLFFEAVSLPRDQITFEADDSGNLISFNGGDFEVGSDGTIYQGTDNRRLDPITSGSIFSSLVDTVLSSSIDNFVDLRSISTVQSPGYDNFETDVDFIDFSISNSSPFSNPDGATIDLDNIEPLFMDYRLNHITNFQFLPPIVPQDRSPTGAAYEFGEYVDLNQSRVSTWEELFEKVWPGYPSEEFIPQYKTVNITEGSKSNNILAQFFESGGSDSTSLKKLDVIDYGAFLLDDGAVKHMFFIGKIFIDSVGQPTFVNMFSIILDKESDQ
mgnify:FL=1